MLPRAAQFHQMGVHLLLSKRNQLKLEFLDNPHVANILKAYDLDGAIRHWALRVGDQVYDLVSYDNIINTWRKREWSEVEHGYNVADDFGWTTATHDKVEAEAQRLINEMPKYHLVNANCQVFVMDLAGTLPRFDGIITAEHFANHDAWVHISAFINDVERRIKNANSWTAAGTRSLKDILDRFFERLTSFAVGATSASLIFLRRKLMAAMSKIFALMAYDAPTWLLQGLKQVVLRMSTIVQRIGTTLPTLPDLAGLGDFIRQAGASLLRFLNQFPGWIAYSPDAQTVIIMAVVVLAFGAVVPLAWVGGKKAWKWFKSCASIPDDELPGQQMEELARVVQRHGRVRPVAV